MARANRWRGEGGIFHLTHRCHNRAFLLKFARDRDAYSGAAARASPKVSGGDAGLAGFVKGIQPPIRWRSELEIVETAEGGTWMLQESAVPYGQNTGPKNSSEGIQAEDMLHIPLYLN